MATQRVLEPPSFVSEKKSYSTYKNDLRRWARITTVKKELQAEVVVYSLEGHSSGIKEKIDVQIGEKLQGNDKGIDDLIEYLDTIYEKDEMSDAWHKYKTFQKVSRQNGQEVKHLLRSLRKSILLQKRLDVRIPTRFWHSDCWKQQVYRKMMRSLYLQR